MHPRRRVVVTGMGVLAPNGTGLKAFWQSLIAGESGIGPITLFDASGFKSRIAGEVKNFNPDDYFEPAHEAAAHGSSHPTGLRRNKAGVERRRIWQRRPRLFRSHSSGGWRQHELSRCNRTRISSCISVASGSGNPIRARRFESHRRPLTLLPTTSAHRPTHRPFPPPVRRAWTRSQQPLP